MKRTEKKYLCGCVVSNRKGKLFLRPCLDRNCPVVKTVRLSSMSMESITRELLLRSANKR